MEHSTRLVLARCTRVAGLVLSAAIVLMLGMAGGQEGQEPEVKAAAGKAAGGAQAKPEQAPAGKGAAKKGGLRVPVGAAPKGRRVASDPLAPGEPAAAPVAEGPRIPRWPFHYSLRIKADDGNVVLVDYYPAQEPFQAPAVILIHETGPNHTRKDFEQPIDDLKGVGLVRHLQDQGYAVLTFDVRRSEQANPAAAREIALRDLQAAYRFLVDRHNRGEVNLGKLGVVGVGDGANLALGWAATPGGGVSSEGRLSDIGALVLVSPVADSHGASLARVLPTIASRFPLGTLSGDKDETSLPVVRENQRIFERNRLSRVTYYDTSLRGDKLLTFFPKVAADLVQFLDDPVKFRKVEWEPRYLLDPVEYEVSALEPDSGFVQPPAAPPARPEAEKKKAQ